MSSFKHQAIEDLARDYRFTPATLYAKVDPKWIPKKFLLYTSLKIAQTIRKKDGRLIICWPPRHGKSRLTTIASPLWCLENFPDKNIILSTYGADLSTDFGREVRDTMEKNKQVLRESIRPDVKSVGRFMTTKGGGMLSVGLGGAITGKGADTFLIDDYIKTMKEALSETKRNDDWEWFTGTAYHRLEPGASMIIVATRWHHDDLIGRILRHFPGEFDVIKLKAIADDHDPLGRAAGEALFPERYDVEALENRRKVLGTPFFDALFQQEPHVDDAAWTNGDWLEVVDYLPDPSNLEFVRVWDFGGRRGKENDPSVGVLLAINRDTRQTFICDIWEGRKSPATVEATVKAKAEMDGLDTTILIEQEPGASGIQVIDHYKRTVLPDYHVIAAPSTTSKIVRAQPFIANCEFGRTLMLRRPWNEDFKTQFDSFPHGDHDDQMDCCAIGFNYVVSMKSSNASWGRTPPQLSAVESDSVMNGLTWGRRRRA